MTQDRFVRARAFHVLALATALAGNVILTHAQTADDRQRNDSQASVSESLHELQAQVAELKTLIVQMHEEAAQSRAETEELRRELQATHEPAAKEQGSVEAGAGNPGGNGNRAWWTANNCAARSETGRRPAVASRQN